MVILCRIAPFWGLAVCCWCNVWQACGQPWRSPLRMCNMVSICVSCGVSIWNPWCQSIGTVVNAPRKRNSSYPFWTCQMSGGFGCHSSQTAGWTKQNNCGDQWWNWALRRSQQLDCGSWRRGWVTCISSPASDWKFDSRGSWSKWDCNGLLQSFPFYPFWMVGSWWTHFHRQAQRFATSLYWRGAVFRVLGDHSSFLAQNSMVYAIENAQVFCVFTVLHAA